MIKIFGVPCLLLIMLSNLTGQATYSDTLSDIQSKKENKKTEIGGYGQIDFNQQVGDTARHNGNLDVHRFVILMVHHFNKRVSFTSEIEFEHVKEVFVEQAVIYYSLNNSIKI